MRTWSVYIIQSATDGRLYTGVSPDVDARVATHNAGKGARATRGRGPWVLVYLEPRGTHVAALRREWAIKRMRRDAKLRLIAAWQGRT